MIDELFLMLGWDPYGFHKKKDRTRYVALVFLHLVGSVGHVVQSGESGGRERSTPNFLCSGGTLMDSTKSVPGHVMMKLCFCIRWDLRVTQCSAVRLGV
jgi:hypothetical protein